MPEDLGQYIGQADFEQALGVLMKVCGYTANEALSALSTYVSHSRLTVEEIVFRLRRSPTVYGLLVCN